MKHLSIDIETRSSVDIGKAGLYKYAQSPDFRILLFAFQEDENPVEVVDLSFNLISYFPSTPPQSKMPTTPIQPML